MRLIGINRLGIGHQDDDEDQDHTVLYILM